MAVDDLDGTIEIQHFDGTIEELDPEEWLGMLVRQADPPEDWSGSLDISSEDLPETTPMPTDWLAELDSLDDAEPIGTD